MCPDPDTFLVTVYCLVDDIFREKFAHLKPKGPGRKPVFSDSEVLTLAVVGQWGRGWSERGMHRYAEAHWRGYFPNLPSQSSLNRRTRALGGVLAMLGREVSEKAREVTGVAVAYEVVDSVPVPLARRCRGSKGKLFGEDAGIGRGGSDKEWYYGVKVLVAVGQDHFITGFVAARANTEDRWLAEALLRWRRDPRAARPSAEDLAGLLGPAHRNGGRRLGPEGAVGPRAGAGRQTGLPYIGDLGFAGAAWQGHWKESYGADVLTKRDYDRSTDGAHRKRLSAWLSGLRQKVETAFSILTSVFGLSYPRARTLWGLMTRLSAKVDAYDIAVYINYMLKRPPLSIISPI